MCLLCAAILLPHGHVRLLNVYKPSHAPIPVLPHSHTYSLSYNASRAAVAVQNLLLRLLGSLQVLVCEERGRTTRHQDEVEGYAAQAGRGGLDGGAGLLGLGCWVAGLGEVSKMRFPNTTGSLGACLGGSTYHALQCANLDAGEDLAGLVAVSNILESLSGILSGNIEQDLLSTSVI